MTACTKNVFPYKHDGSMGKQEVKVDLALQGVVQ